MPRQTAQSSTSFWESYSDSWLRDCDKWVCTSCGNVYYFKRLKQGFRGGPPDRAIDRRYGWYTCHRTCKRRRIIRHVSTPQPSPQPKQDEALLALLRDAKQPKGKKGTTAPKKGRVSRVRASSEE